MIIKSKAQVDKVGQLLSKELNIDEEEVKQLEDVFDEFRKLHLQPLSSTTVELQNWLKSYSSSYFIAQRLKRKPQILRKLKRFDSRLTQLQDIGGLRIIVERNSEVEKLVEFIKEKVKTQSLFQIHKEVDYREKGRDDSGYRAVHLILKRENVKLELQIRSRIQHYWAELIERTSVIYGHFLKELEGDPAIIQYFKTLSNIFYEN